MGEESLARLKARPDRYAEMTGRLALHSVPSLLALLDETYGRTDWLADCARIRCPVLVVAGERDSFPTAAMSARVAETIPGARLHVVRGGTHFPNRSHRAEVQAVEARQRQAVAQYQKSLQQSFREVRQALSTQMRAREVYDSEGTRSKALAEALRLSRIRYASGLLSQLDIIDAERNYLQAELNRADALAAQRAAVADLVKALGGGWSGLDPETIVGAAPSGK